MKQQIKYILAILIMSTSLFIGVQVGNSDPVPSQDDPRGFVCTETSGICDENYNETCCQWGSTGCDTTPGTCN